MAATKTPKNAPSDLGLQSTGDVTVDAALMNAAETYGVPPAVMFATAQQESGLNPSAVGDQGTSFGLFQEHEGGELTSVSFADNPVTAANLAAQNFAAMRAQMPQATWGQIVAASQRPANQAAYAQSVNSMLGKAGQMPAGPAAKALGGTVSTALATPGGVGAAAPAGPVNAKGQTVNIPQQAEPTNTATPALEAYAQLGGIVNESSVPQTSSLYNQATTGLTVGGIAQPGSSPQQIAQSIQNSYPVKS